MVNRVEQAENLLIEQYKSSPNLKSFVQSHSIELQGVEDENLNLLNKRGIDSAEGVNLDVIGKIVVLERPFTDPDPEFIFTFDNPSEVGLGYTNVQKSLQGGYFIGLDPIDNQRYPDSIYRYTLKAKVIYNTTNASLADMHKYAKFVFDAEALIFERPGVIDINISRPIGKQERGILEATFPRPAGVRIGSLSYSTEDGAFGFTGDPRNGGFGNLNDPSVGGVFSSLIID